MSEEMAIESLAVEWLAARLNTETKHVRFKLYGPNRGYPDIDAIASNSDKGILAIAECKVQGPVTVVFSYSADDSILDDKSLLIVGDTGNERLLRYSYQDRNLKGGTEIKVPELSNPIRLQINSKEEIFALDGKKRRIFRLSSEGAFKGYVDAEGVPSPSTFVPRSFKIDGNNNIYILDIFTGRVLVLNPEGKYQKQIPFPKDFGFFSDLSVDSEGYSLVNRLCQGHGFFSR
jgi:sugar lactone lactonase YvrE